jgi:hypothetical protein
MPTDLELAYNALVAKQDKYNRLYAYYDGNQPLIYSTRRLQEAFNKLDARFVENWMSVVIDAVNDRLELLRFAISRPKNEADEVETTDDEDPTETRLNELLTNTELLIDSFDVHLAALVTGEGYVICWPDEDTGEPDAYYNDPRQCHLFYESYNPKRKRFGCKWWCDDENKRRLTLYYPDRLEYYVSKNDHDKVTKYNDFNPVEDYPEAPNPYGEVPIFHFRRERRAICSEIEKVIDLQDAINKLLADMMVAAEFGAFPQRYIISNADVGTLKNAANEIWNIPSGDGESEGTSVGQFDAADLNNYQQVISARATAIGIITRTPKHFFYSQTGDPSGEALIAMEAPLNDKAAAYIKRLAPVWRDVGVFLLKLDGVTIDDPSIVSAIFDEPQTIQPYTQALIRKTNVEATLPLKTVLRAEGWTDPELAQIDQDREKQPARPATPVLIQPPNGGTPPNVQQSNVPDLPPDAPQT